MPSETAPNYSRTIPNRAKPGMIVDLFCGGGGASEGIRRALGRCPDVAADHDPASILMHGANHPSTIHLCKSVHDVTPRATTNGRAVDLLWLSPDCTHFSRAKGGRPRKQSIRDLAWVGVSWAEQRTLDPRRPMNTITAKGSQGAAVVAWLVKHNTGVIGHTLRRELGTITARDSHALGTAGLVLGVHPDRSAQVAAFLVAYYGRTKAGQRLDEPMHTIVKRARFGLVTVTLDGEPWTVADIGMRMLQPRELATAQGFGSSYVLTGTKAQQIGRIGNSVPPQVVAAVVGAQFEHRTTSMSLAC